MKSTCALVLAFLSVATATSFLEVNRSTNTFSFNGQRVFLSGANQPWIDYGNDFGNHQSNGKICSLQQYIANLTEAGGNSMRMWLFIEGDSIPSFDSQGMVNGTDNGGSLIDELRTYLQYAAANNVFVNLALWNGAVLRNPNTISLFSSPQHLQAFIDKALTPLVKALANEPGLGAWEIINEPEGSLKLVTDSDPCYDTQTALANTGAGWAGHSFTMQQLLVFINKQSAAIHRADPKALVTVGSWAQWVLSDALQPYQSKGFRNYYKDSCLAGAGGEADGILDFYQVHQYPSEVGTGSDHAPFAAAASDYQLDKPLIIGEFAHKSCTSKGCTVTQLFEYAYDKGYQGAWGWALNAWTSSSVDGQSDIVPGLQSIQNKPFVSVTVGGTPPADTCSCSDIGPDQTYTCVQQASWGKCAEPFLKGFCCRSCHACKGCAAPAPPTPPAPANCTDVPPAPGTYSCEKQKEFGKCDVTVNPWMAGYCCKSCFNCDPKCGAAGPTPTPPAPPKPTPPTPAGCTDVPPAPGTYSCEQQKTWGKCDIKVNPWMAGYCCKSCFNCDPKCGK